MCLRKLNGSNALTGVIRRLQDLAEAAGTDLNSAKTAIVLPPGEIASVMLPKTKCNGKILAFYKSGWKMEAERLGTG